MGNPAGDFTVNFAAPASDYKAPEVHERDPPRVCRPRGSYSMPHDRDTTLKQERRWTSLTTKFIAALILPSAVFLATSLAGWWALRTASREITATQLATGNGSMAALADGLLVSIDEARLLLAVGIIAGVISMACLCVYFIRTIVNPLQENSRLMTRLAAGNGNEDVSARQLARNDEIGDLTRAIRNAISRRHEEVKIATDMSAGNFTGAVAVRDTTDELGLAIQKMANVTMETLRRVNAHVGQVMAGCEAITSASRELTANSSDINSVATGITTDIAQIRTHADDNADLAEQAGRLANTGSHSVERGYEDIGEMGVVMLNMQACGDKIVGIAKSIGDIAFQTNLLALNASVEAARAGRNGKGFTIVAEEVRRLATRTSQAAKETSTLMKETVEQVELAAAIAGRINATFAEMQANNQETEALLTKIAAASREQSDGIDQISAALRQVDQSARKNMEHGGDVTEMVGSLIRHTDRLRQIMRRFRLGFAPPPIPGPLPESETALSGVDIPRAIDHAASKS